MGICCFDTKKKEETSRNVENQVQNEIINRYELFNGEEIKKLNLFSETLEIQLSEYENINNNNYDRTYYNLKKYELEKLTEAFNNNLEKFKKSNLSPFKLDMTDNDLIEEIRKNENTHNKFRDKIFKKIDKIIEDKNKYKINYLTILLGGRKNVGKTSLIKYILESDKNGGTEIIEQDKYFSIYKNDTVPYIHLVEFKGIGYNKNSDPNKIGENIYNYINNHIKLLNMNNNDDVVHCIWYCLTGSRLDKNECQILKKLKKLYNVEKMPIIVVFTKTQDKVISNQMREFIYNQKIDVLFVETVAEDIIIDDNNNCIKPYGKEELLKTTLEISAQCLKGQLITLMVKNISKDLLKELKEENKKNENDIKTIINDFINNYKNVLKDGYFIQYIINIIIKSLEKFYDENKISNKTQNLLNESNFIKEIKSFIKSIKSEVKEIIKPIIKEKSNEFINIQAQKEKECGNLDLNKKRRLKGFKKTNEIFLKKNFYFVIQKFLINYIIQNIYQDLIGNYRKLLDLIVEELLNMNEQNNSDIYSHLEYCYLKKLKSFADERNINIDIHPKPLNKKNYEPNIKDDTNLDFEINNTDSFDLGLGKNNNNNDIININKINEDENNEWFPLIDKKFKYINEQEEKLLTYFLNEIEDQDTYFNQDSLDEPFKSLNSYIKIDLLNFINENKKKFISNLIDKNYNKKQFNCSDNINSEIISLQDLKYIYEEKLKQEFNLLINNNEFTKIDYLTILIMGKSGVGKSTLVNSFLKEELAETGVGYRVTLKDGFYKNDKIPFLNLIDTRGFELNREFSPNKIYADAMKTIENQIKKENRTNNYNNYVQCIWYCVSEGNLEEEELKLITQLKLKEKNIPLIIVYTNAINIEEINKMKKIIQNKFNNLPFIDVLGKKIERKESYGLDDLLNLTLKTCKNVQQGDIFNKIKNILENKITNIFKEKFETFKKNGYELAINHFIQKFKKIQNTNEDLIQFLWNLIEILLKEFMKDTSGLMKEINEDSENIFKESVVIKFTENFFIFYEKKVKEIIDPILKTKAINYLNLQVQIELNKNKSINEENKSDEKIFIENMKTFLQNHLYYISQKYFVYHFISEEFEPFSSEIENQINKIIKRFFTSEDAKNLFIKNYLEKFENFEAIVDQKRINKFIYK